MALRTIHLHSKGFEPLHHYHYQGWPSAFFCVLHFLFLPSPCFSLGKHVSVVVQICFAKFDAGHQEFAYATLHAQFAPYASRTQSFHLAIDERDIQVSASSPNLRLVLLFTLLGTHRRFGFSCATAKQRNSRSRPPSTGARPHWPAPCRPTTPRSVHHHSRTRGEGAGFCGRRTGEVD